MTLHRKTPLKRTPFKKTPPWKAKAKEQEKKKAKAAPTKQSLVKKLDRIFQLYIRLRDVNNQGAFRCISCGRYKPFSQMDAGHFIGRAAMSLRYCTSNVFGQCRYCNRILNGNLLDYRKSLVQKLGEEKVEWLEAQKHSTKSYSCFELETLIDFYTKEVKKLKIEKNYDEWK